jgi:iron complex outermembrane recepter protein
MILAGVMPHAVNAQQAATPASQPQASGGLEEIVVTANKRRENIQDVPIAIEAISASQLQAQGIQTTQDVASAIPGLTMQGSMNGLQAHLRGVGTSAIQAGEENSIATYVDGVYIASLSGSLLQLNSIEQIEVDKGPQGTLFGRNATGGVISVTTKDPSHAFGGSAGLSYGNYNTIQQDTYVTGGLSESLAADFAFFYSNQGEGYGRNLYNGRDVNKIQDLATRSKWLFTPTSEDRATLAVDYEQTHSSAFDTFQPLPGHPTNWGPGAPAPTGQPFLFPGGPWDTDTPAQPYDNFKQGGISLNVQHDFNFARLTNITAFREADKNLFWSANPVPTPAEQAGWQEQERQLTEEVQLASAGDSAIKWVGGLFFLNGAAAYSPFLIQGTAAAPVPLESINFLANETTKSYAAFGQATTPISFLSDTNFTAGLRYTSERRGINGSTILNFVPPIPSVETGITDTHKTFDKITWRFALDHHFTDNVLGFISYNRGFKSGVYNTIPAGGPTATPVNPEVLDATEMGVKSDFFNRRLRVNASAFFYNYSQLQVTVFTPTHSDIENGASAHIYGLDLDIQGQITDQFTVSAGIEALHSEFVSFPNAQILIPQTVAEGGGNLPEFGSAAGNRLPYTPNASVNLTANYKIPTSIGLFDLDAAYSYRSSWFATPDNHLRSPISNIVNAQVSWNSSHDENTEYTLWGRNLTNQAVPMFMSEANNPGGYDEQINQPPRTYGVKVEHKF